MKSRLRFSSSRLKDYIIIRVSNGEMSAKYSITYENNMKSIFYNYRLLKKEFIKIIGINGC